MIQGGESRAFIRICETRAYGSRIEEKSVVIQFLGMFWVLKSDPYFSLGFTIRSMSASLEVPMKSCIKIQQCIKSITSTATL